MASDHHIKKFTATDIEKYHKGLLSAREMHDLEKAAMDDPFLADALEGYAVAGVNVAADITELKRRLAAKTDGAKVIPIGTAPKNSFRILKAAIVIAFIAGAGLLIYQFGFNKKDKEIAKAETNEKAVTPVSDSVKPSTTQPPVGSSTPVPVINPVQPKDAIKQNEKGIRNPDAEAKPGNSVKSTVGETPVGAGTTNVDDMMVKKAAETQPLAPPPVVTADKQKEAEVADNVAASKEKEAAREEALKNNARANRQKTENAAIKDDARQPNNRSVAAPRQANEPVNRDQNQSANIFRGRVTDADNRGVPFANLTTIEDNNAATYTDAKGYFNLASPDSVVTVQVRSVGFESNNVQLRNTVENNRVILQDDSKNLSEVVVSQQKPNALANKKENNQQPEGPEPADGWGNYTTYLTNNLAVPDDLKTRQAGGGDVRVSFEVDKNGNPVNLKVEKSLCTGCDKEALRLIKDGPKWKRKAKKARTTVSVHF
jgi:flagellar basal body-associated protein FliL